MTIHWYPVFLCVPGIGYSTHMIPVTHTRSFSGISGIYPLHIPEYQKKPGIRVCVSSMIPENIGYSGMGIGYNMGIIPDTRFT